jgi:hypothetical protein
MSTKGPGALSEARVFLSLFESIFRKKEVTNMKRSFVMLVILGLAVTLAVPAFCGEEEEYSREEDYGCQMMGPGHGMGHGLGHGMGHGYMRPRAWRSMKPEQREKC